MTINSNITYPKASDIPDRANDLIGAIAKAMLDEGESASLVAVMRRDIITTICEYYPWAYRAKTRGAA